MSTAKAEMYARRARNSDTVENVSDYLKRAIDELVMRTVAIAFAALFLSTIGANADGTWCANYSNQSGSNCGFYSFEQCQATVSGIGGFCMRNPFSPSAAEPRRRYRR
jgi:hypothetical protein